MTLLLLAHNCREVSHNPHGFLCSEPPFSPAGDARLADATLALEPVLELARGLVAPPDSTGTGLAERTLAGPAGSPGPGGATPCRA
mmetsp:Transcript_74137/g.143461  ORF Transcript_74137/g.143461 Transcript_74137/m.143461 type:complete len:86 (-) Transcript_74137:496-753(-)